MTCAGWTTLRRRGHWPGSGSLGVNRNTPQLALTSPQRIIDEGGDEIASAKRMTEIYKSWIGQMLKDIEVHHILPRPDDLHWEGVLLESQLQVV